jgi:hypothetical protein
MWRFPCLIVCACGVMSMSCSSLPTPSPEQPFAQHSGIRSVEAIRCDSSTAQAMKDSGQKLSCAEPRSWWEPSLDALSGAAMAVRSPRP